MRTGIQVMDSVHHTVEKKGYPDLNGMGMDPGFHRGDENAGMTVAKVGIESSTLDLDLESGVVQFSFLNSRTENHSRGSV